MSKNLRYLSDYKELDGYRLSFNRLAALTFGIDFEKWYQLGLWNSSYVCHSYADQNEIIANVSVSKQQMIVNGSASKGLQIGAVMTHPDYRGKGLSRKLMETVLADYEQEYDFIHLTANSGVLEFYPKFGFQVWEQHRFIWEDTFIPEEKIKLRKLDVNKEHDLEILLGLVKSRKPISRIFDSENTASVVMWHCLYEFPDNIYTDSLGKLLVLAEEREGVLHVYELFGSERVILRDLLVSLLEKPVQQVEFHFTPDLLDAPVMTLPSKSDGTFFVRRSKASDLPPFCYPAAHTT